MCVPLSWLRDYVDFDLTRSVSPSASPSSGWRCRGSGAAATTGATS